MEKCTVEWCDSDRKIKEHCNRHYRQLLKWGEIKRSRGDKNEIVIRDTYAEIVLYDINYKEKARAIIDRDDVERCSKYKWVIRNDGYVSTKVNNKGIKLHRFIANTPKGLHTDHINRNKLDNRKINLNICTQLENNKNKNTYKNNMTGRRGVMLRDGRYIVSIKFNNKREHIGSYSGFQEAVKAREAAEIERYGYILEDI